MRSFAVLKDDDGPKMKQVFDWALAEGREQDISAELREAVQTGQWSDARDREADRSDESGTRCARL